MNTKLHASEVIAGTSGTPEAPVESPPGACLLCGSLAHRPIFNENGIAILHCQQCGHVFSSFSADPHFDGYWGNEVPESEHYYWSKARVRMHRDFFEKFMAGRSGRLLDMGCGLGFFVKAVASQAGWDAYGCEISSAAVGYAREKLGLKNILCTRLEDAPLPRASFDIVTLWDVIDHIPQPDAVLRRCYALLKPGGMLFIRTPNVSLQLLRARLKKLLLGMRQDGNYLQARDHAHHYSMRSIRRLLERNGFPDTEFVHLHPIGGMTSRKDFLVRGMKNLCFAAIRTLAFLSRGRLNLDNLFVVTRKPH